MDTMTYPIIDVSTAPNGAITADDYKFYATNTSTVWEIVKAQTNCDLVTLDNAFEKRIRERYNESKAFTHEL